MTRLTRGGLAALCLIVMAGGAGCHEPTRWSYTGPRVYLIQGTADEDSDALWRFRDELRDNEINVAVYNPDNWLKVVVDIDKKPDEEAILVGHGHGAFLCTQVVRHYAQKHKTKFIEAVFTIDAYNKDWPENVFQGCCLFCCEHHGCGGKCERCGKCCDGKGDCDKGGSAHFTPTPIPLGHNCLAVHNWRQANPDSRVLGADLVSTRASNVAMEHPYYWYDHYWYDRPITGQHIGTEMTSADLRHQTIDSDEQLVQRIIRLCRKEALSPFHYTPPEHHPDVEKEAQPQRQPRTAGKQT